MQHWLRHPTSHLTRSWWVAGWPFTSRWNSRLRLSEPHVYRLHHLEWYAQFGRQTFPESEFEIKCFLGTFAGTGPDEDTDTQEGPEISWWDLIVNSLQCMRSIAMATEAVAQWQQLQLRAFTAIPVCIKGSIYLLLTMITEQLLSNFTDHCFK